jgi:hypothetical protein
VKRKKLTRAEREEWEAERARMLEHTQRTRELAERAQARLDSQSSSGRSQSPGFQLNPTKAERETERTRMLENAQRTRELAERAQAKLERQRSSE